MSSSLSETFDLSEAMRWTRSGDLKGTGPQIKLITLPHFGSPKTDLDEARANSIIANCPNTLLLEFSISTKKNIGPLNILLKDLPHLRHLTLQRSDNKLISELDTSKLLSLELSFYRKEDESLKNILDSITAPKLKYLTVRGNVGKEIDSLDSLAFPELEYVFLVSSHGVFGIQLFCFDVKRSAIRKSHIFYSKYARGFGIDFGSNPEPFGSHLLSTQFKDIDAFFQTKGFESDFERRFSKAKGVNLFLRHYNSDGFYKLLTGMQHLEYMILGIESKTEVTFPDIQFNATSLSLDVFSGYASTFLEWVSTHFKNLKILSLHSPALITDNLQFKLLEKVSSKEPQGISFWTQLLVAAPNIKEIYASEDEVSLLGEKFSNILVTSIYDFQDMFSDDNELQKFYLGEIN